MEKKHNANTQCTQLQLFDLPCCCHTVHPTSAFRSALLLLPCCCCFAAAAAACYTRLCDRFELLCLAMPLKAAGVEKRATLAPTQHGYQVLRLPARAKFASLVKQEQNNQKERRGDVATAGSEQAASRPLFFEVLAVDPPLLFYCFIQGYLAFTGHECEAPL